MEERFCQKVKQLGCTCVTISHRPALMAFHDIVLALDGEGGWSLHRGARRLHSEEGHSDAPAGDPPIALKLRLSWPGLSLLYRRPLL